MKLLIELIYSIRLLDTNVHPYGVDRCTDIQRFPTSKESTGLSPKVHKT